MLNKNEPRDQNSHGLTILFDGRSYSTKPLMFNSSIMNVTVTKNSDRKIPRKMVDTNVVPHHNVFGLVPNYVEDRLLEPNTCPKSMLEVV